MFQKITVLIREVLGRLKKLPEISEEDIDIDLLLDNK